LKLHSPALQLKSSNTLKLLTNYKPHFPSRPKIRKSPLPRQATRKLSSHRETNMSSASSTSTPSTVARTATTQSTLTTECTHATSRNTMGSVYWYLASINIGTVGRVADGESTLGQAIDGGKAVCHQAEMGQKHHHQARIRFCRHIQVRQRLVAPNGMLQLLRQ
jgi:hypothetical protein